MPSSASLLISGSKFSETTKLVADKVLIQGVTGEASNTLSARMSIRDIAYDFIKFSVWNTDHSGEFALSEMWYSSSDRDIYAVRADTGDVANYVQGDYKLKAYMLYYYDPETTPKPESLDDVLKNCTLVQSITEADKHYDISGLKWNVSVAFYDRERTEVSV